MGSQCGGDWFGKKRSLSGGCRDKIRISDGEAGEMWMWGGIEVWKNCRILGYAI